MMVGAFLTFRKKLQETRKSHQFGVDHSSIKRSLVGGCSEKRHNFYIVFVITFLCFIKKRKIDFSKSNKKAKNLRSYHTGFGGRPPRVTRPKIGIRQIPYKNHTNCIHCLGRFLAATGHRSGSRPGMPVRGRGGHGTWPQKVFLKVRDFCRRHLRCGEVTSGDTKSRVRGDGHAAKRVCQKQDKILNAVCKNHDDRHDKSLS